ncbi:MAG: DNA repair protein RecO [Bacteroidales bacterium]|jgi:DNA repair protein RecO (recombination protein O)|nr:DNA repair protein RecO [Bacteroidales bacterium]
MLYKTAGIVLHTTKFSDKLQLVHIFTEEFGSVTYGVAPGSSKKHGRKTAFLQPFSLLQLEVEHKNSREIHRIRESRLHIPLESILLNPLKITISLFLAEFVYRAVKEHSPNKPLYEFLLQSILALDLLRKGIANFHIVFLFKLTRCLGFFPNTASHDKQKTIYFDMQNGIFVSIRPLHKHYLLPEETHVFGLLLRMNFDNMHLFKLSQQERMSIIRKIIEYYRLHLTEFSIPKSLDVLHEVFS